MNLGQLSGNITSSTSLSDNLKMDVQIKNSIEGMITSIISWLSNSKIGKEDTKREQIAQSLFWTILENDITVELIEAIQLSLRTFPFQFANGHVYEQLDNYMQANNLQQFTTSFWENVAELTPSGLNTSPTACCGKYELLYGILRPNSEQPNKGDAVDEGSVIEIKGTETRIFSPDVSGLEYIKTTNAIFGKDFEGNSTETKIWENQKVFEIEKTINKDHYSEQFAKNPIKARELIEIYLIKNKFIEGSENASKAAIRIISDTGEFAQDVLQYTILSTFFEKYKEQQGFDKMIVFGDGTNVKIIETVRDLFNHFEIDKDFFRIGQSHKLAWYIRPRPSHRLIRRRIR